MYTDQYLAAYASALSQAGLTSTPHRKRIDSPRDGDYRFRFYDVSGVQIADITIARTAPDPDMTPVDWS